MTEQISIGYSNFCRLNSTAEAGNSNTILSEKQLIQIVKEHWHERQPGYGETSLDRKVVVPVPAYFDKDRYGWKAGMLLFRSSTVLITPEMDGVELKARLVKRKGQKNEMPTVQTYLPLKTARELGFKTEPVKNVKIVLYEKAALLENDGERSSSCDWEIVTILASTENDEPMHIGSMVRNQLEQAGGTKTEYTLQDYLRSLEYWGKRIKVME